jgi:hypothetical protein
VIDYAGLFPPAELPLKEAVREFLAIRQSPEAWMLGAFVIPASRVTELEPWADDLFRRDQPMKLALLSRPADDPEDWTSKLGDDLHRSGGFIDRHLDGIASTAWEIAPPAKFQVGSTLSAILAIVEDLTSSRRITNVFCEVPGSPEAAELRQSMIEIHACNPNSPLFGFKLRTGGPTAKAFPTVRQLASIVHACQQHHCRWKATAGLHHPLRHFDAGLGVRMHGFLNVLFAAVLADAHSLPESQIAEVLADEDAANFHVTDDGIRWRDGSASVAQIESTRWTTFQSFGSCSFAEPRDELKSLGLL